MRIAIVGAGLAGLSCAARLRAAGHQPTVFEKSRGVGGRLATRRASVAGREIGFDHGAQYITVRDPAFRAAMRSWADAGAAAPWPAAGADAWVGVPGMSAPAKQLATGLDVRLGRRVTALEPAGSGWRVRTEEDDDAERFDVAIAALPAEQAAVLLAPVAPDWATLAAATPSAPCWTVMAAFETQLPVREDVLSKRPPIAWAARNSAKPGRGGPEAWVIQADPDWSARALEHSPEAAAAALLDAFAAELDIPLPSLLHCAAHRWRFARSGTADRIVLWDPDRRLGVCGDWLIGPRVENAFASGVALAEAVER